MGVLLASSNKLLASQVDRGSMAYVLSTPKRRSSIVLMQVIYSLTSIASMFVISTIIHLAVNHFVPLTPGEAGIEVPGLVAAKLSGAMIFKINLSAMLVCLAMGRKCKTIYPHFYRGQKLKIADFSLIIKTNKYIIKNK